MKHAGFKIQYFNPDFRRSSSKIYLESMWGTPVFRWLPITLANTTIGTLASAHAATAVLPWMISLSTPAWLKGSNAVTTNTPSAPVKALTMDPLSSMSPFARVHPIVSSSLLFLLLGSRTNAVIRQFHFDAPFPRSNASMVALPCFPVPPQITKCMMNTRKENAGCYNAPFCVNIPFVSFGVR